MCTCTYACIKPLKMWNLCPAMALQKEPSRSHQKRKVAGGVGLRCDDPRGPRHLTLMLAQGKPDQG